MATTKLSEKPVVTDLDDEVRIFITTKEDVEGDMVDSIRRTTFPAFIEMLKQHGIDKSHFDELCFNAETGELHVLNDGKDVIGPCYIGKFAEVDENGIIPDKNLPYFNKSQTIYVDNTPLYGSRFVDMDENGNILIRADGAGDYLITALENGTVMAIKVKTHVLDTIESDSETDALSAKQGKILSKKDNELQSQIDEKADKSNHDGGFVGGTDASATTGGAVGEKAQAINGGAIGNGAYTQSGGAVGNVALAVNGGAVGNNARAESGGAVGKNAHAGNGFAGGVGALTQDESGAYIDAIQLGTGANPNPKTLQVYDYELLDADGHIPNLCMPSKADRTEILDDHGMISDVTYDFSIFNNVEYRNWYINSISFAFPDGVYPLDYMSGLSFSVGDTAPEISYSGSGILNWVGTDCSVSDGLSVFAPKASMRYDIVFYYNGAQFVGLVNGFKPAAGNGVSA